MLINIDEIVVNDRIRKDFGDLQELADNISENTLMNPPVVTPNGDGTYLLIAGERRLRAMRDILGYKQTEVNVVTPRDAEQMLLMEISENECRKEFTMTERLNYAAKIRAVESAKAQERMLAGKADPTPKSADGGDKGETRDKVAEAIGMGHTKLAQAQFVENNRDLLDPADFAEWDEGRLSTNKAYQRIKAAQAQAERERDLAEKERDAAKFDLAEAYRESELLETEIASLKRQVAEKPKPEVVEREVVREVVPDDYETTKRKLASLTHDNQIYIDSNNSLRKELDEARKELDKAKDIIGIDKTSQDGRRDVLYLISATNSYVRRYGGLTWTVQQLSEVDKQTIDNLQKAVRNLATFSSALMDNLEEIDGI